ncbi:membrane protein, partial [Xanthomonas axonopodis]
MATTERAPRYMGLIAATVFVLALAGFGVTLPGYLQASHP